MQDHYDEINKFNENAERQRRVFQDRISAIEKERDKFDHRCQVANKTIIDSNEEVQRLMLQIADCMRNMKALEHDKADIYQKMIASDRLIRQEMTDKFAKEKQILEETYRNEKDRAIAEFESTSRAEQQFELKNIVDDMRLKQAFELQAVAAEHSRKYDGFLAEMNEKNLILQGLEETVTSAKEEIQHLNEEFKVKTEELQATNLKEMEELKAQWETQSQAREKAIKVQSAIAISNLEKKHGSALSQMEEDYKQQLKNLEEQNVLALAALQKEADLLKSLEISRIHQAHREEQEEIQNTHHLDLESQVQKFNSDLDAAIAELVTDYDAQIKELKDRIAELENFDMIHYVNLVNRRKQKRYSKKVYKSWRRIKRR
jgi:hypothetical protein